MTYETIETISHWLLLGIWVPAGIGLVVSFVWDFIDRRKK